MTREEQVVEQALNLAVGNGVFKDLQSTYEVTHSWGSLKERLKSLVAIKEGVKTLSEENCGLRNELEKLKIPEGPVKIDTDKPMKPIKHKG